MHRTIFLVIAAIALPSCAGIALNPQNPRELAAARQAQDLLWVIESEDGGTIGSATSFGSGLLLASASNVENWVGQNLRVRQGATVAPVESMRLAVRQNFAILSIQGPRVGTPAVAERPHAAERLAIAGANHGRTFTGLGPVLSISSPVEGLPNIDELVVASLPVAGGFAGAPVVDVNGRLVGIASSVLRWSRLAPEVPQHVTPGTPLSRQALAILPMELVHATIRAEGLDQPPR